MYRIIFITYTFAVAAAFAPSPRRSQGVVTLMSTSSQEAVATKPRSEPRSGFAQQLLNLALASPLWDYVLVPQARASIVKTAEGT